MISVTLEHVRLHNPLNGNKGGHWAGRAKRAKAQRGAAMLAVRAKLAELSPPTLLVPSSVTMLEVDALGEGGGGLIRYSANAAVCVIPPALVVTITRISPGTLDSDAVPASAKHIRDGVADALGINDNDPRVTWEYRQEKGARAKAGTHAGWGVRIEIRSADEVAA